MNRDAILATFASYGPVAGPRELEAYLRRQRATAPSGDVTITTTADPRTGGQSITRYYTENPVWTIVSLLGLAAGAYHGYRRNRSVGWAMWWGFWGGATPFFTVPLSLAQGFGEPKGKD